MGTIALLPELIQNQIAAGEVVERPASVIKELVENSLDAGATSLRIALEEGGLQSIQIQDNGSGMDEEDLRMCTVRYATSKLHTAEELFAISQYGFRGEALASIASVARVTIKSKQAHTDTGLEVRVEGGILSPIVPVGLKNGTIIRIEDLFFNTPARKKYLRSAATELGHISTLLTQYALLHYDKEWLFVHNGKTLLHVHPVETWEQRIAHLLPNQSSTLLPLFLDRPGLHITGWCSPPHHAVTTRKHQYLYVNGRPVRSALLQRACTEAYHRLLSSAEFPVLLLSITIDPALVDVNVHPRKTEVRFEEERQLFQAVHHTLRHALEKQEQHVPVSIPDTPPISTPAAHSSSSFGFGRQASSPYTLRKVATPTAQTTFLWQKQPRTEDPSSLYTSEHTHSSFRIIQQLERCYILIGLADGFAIIDQHAAHERILFERFRHKVEASELITQALAVPELLRLSLSEQALVHEHTDAFAQVGFQIQDMGSGTLGLTHVPSLLGDQDLQRSFTEIMEDMINHVPLETSVHRTQDKILAYTSCKSATKFGDTLTHQEMETLVEDYFATPLRETCPHGRPSIRTFSMTELATFFKRPV